MKKILLISVCLMFSASLFAQDKSYAKEMINKIDSIATVNNIKIGIVASDDSQNREIDYAFVGEFKFDGPFLVWSNTYYNMDKLSYFYIGEKKDKRYFAFIFPGIK